MFANVSERVANEFQRSALAELARFSRVSRWHESCRWGGVSALLHLQDRLGQAAVCCLAGRTWAVYQQRQGDLRGAIVWGEPDARDVATLTQGLRSVRAELTSGIARRASLIDLRRLTAVSGEAFNQLAAYVRARRNLWGRLVSRQALLRPRGLAGAVVAGFYAVEDPGFPARTFEDPREALGWLDAGADESFLDELDRIHRECSAGFELIEKVRAELEHSPRCVASELARRIGTSQRTLQRRFEELGTTFQNERNQAQLRVARRLLLHGNYSVKRVAHEVGCASPQHFSALFQKMTGDSPSAWRARHAERSQPCGPSGRSVSRELRDPSGSGAR